MKDADSPLAEPADGRAFPRSRIYLFIAIAAAGCGLDLLTKQWVFSWLGAPQPDRENIRWLIEPYVGLQTAVNQGALFGMGQGMSGWFAALSVLAAAGIVFWLFFRRGAADLLLTVALAMVMGGIFGNLYDRLGLWHSADAPAYFQHGVRDWVLLRYKDKSWPNFNIADSLLVCGAALLFIHAIFHREPQQASDKNDD